MKTIIELIFDIYMEYSTNVCVNSQKKLFFKNNNNKIQFFAILKIQNYFILENKNKKLKEKNKFNYNDFVSLFFINDYFKLLFTNKKYIKNDLFYFNINDKINDIKQINKFLKTESKFDLIFLIFFLLKIGIYKKNILTKLKNGENILGDNTINMLKQLFNVLGDMQKIIIDEYKKLYIVNKEYCSKSLNLEFPNYNLFKNSIDLKISNEIKNKLNDKLFNEIINDLDSKIINLTRRQIYTIKTGLSLSILGLKKPKSKRGSRNFSFAEFNSNTSPLNEKDFNNNENGIIEGPISFKVKFSSGNLLNFNFQEKKNNILTTTDNEETDNIFNFLEKDSSYINRVIPLQDINNIFCFFEQYDEMYLKNPKKELMNTIFSLCFKKSFYYNDTFNILKKYYLNIYNAEQYTKKLNYPSKMKHFGNGFEPPLFLKYNKSFYVSKVFPITHEFFYNHMINNKIINNSIILFQNEIPIINNITKKNKKDNIDFDYNCELISIDHSFYGHLMNSNDNKYLLFLEKKFELYKKEPINNPSYYSDLFSICTITKKPNKYTKDIINENQRNKKAKIVERGITKKIIILYSEIEQIIERRFLLMWQGIEIYLKNGKSYFFNLLDNTISQKVLDIFKNNIELSKKLIIKDNFERDIYAIQKEWVNDRLDTYEYLLYINKYSSRTYNDSNQYLVFPWLLKDYNKLSEINNNEYEIFKYFNQIVKNKIDDIDESDSEENNKKLSNIGYEYYKYFRELKYPVCAQTEKNKELIVKRYVEDCQFNFKYHSGTHYSTSAYVYFYLMRIEPFSTLLVKLQNYTQENPNRMFNGVQDTLFTLDSGNDNRELLPEFFSKIDFFINFNCVYYGKKVTKSIVDDAHVNKTKIPPSFNLISNIINFLIEHKKLLNSESISLSISDWIDNIFGYNQIPKEEDRPLSCNLYVKSTYEQNTNLKKKLIKYTSPDYKKKVLTPFKIVQKFSDMINMIICFGQTPYQIFKEKHPKRKREELKKIEETKEEKKENEIINKKYMTENENENDVGDDYLVGDDDVQSLIINFIRPEKTISNIKVESIYFEINPFINKVFILSKKREVLILNSKLYDRIGENFYNIFQEKKIELPYFKFFGKINNEYINNYYILKQKYCFSSFIKDEFYDNKSDYTFYYNKYVNELFESNEKSNNDINYYKLITCRYLDNTFKISLIQSNIKKEKEKNKEKSENKNKEINKIFSFECEDFVTSCCAISNNSFLIGLKNGKLIKGKIYEIKNNFIEDENNLDEIELKVNYEKYIQGHNGSINVIEIELRLGIIITGGEDNYIYIRKLYDFELLTPIKIKNKYIITMAKLSPMNLLYVMCLNKINNHSIIFGYNLSGIQFAKSEYGYYSNIDFTKSGNIVSLINKMDIGILYGSNLKRIQIKENDEDCKEFIDNQKKVDGALWMQYDYFTRKTSNSKCRIISYIAKDYSFNTINVDNIKYFD